MPSKFDQLVANLIVGTGLLLMLSGMIGFVGSDLIVEPLAQILGLDPHRIERPIGDLSGVLIDQQQKIYTLDSASLRVQLYTADGHFIGSWKLPLKYKVSQPVWKLDQENRLHYFMGSQHWLLDHASGFVLAPGAFEKLPEPPPLSWEYRIHRPILLPSISKAAPHGRVTLIQSKLHVFGILAGPLFAWLVFFVISLIFGSLMQAANEPGKVSLFGFNIKS